MLNSPPLNNKLNVHLYWQQFLLKDNSEPTEQLWAKARERDCIQNIEKSRELFNSWEINSGLEELESTIVLISLECGLQMGSPSRCLATLQGTVAHPQPPLLNLGPAETRGCQSMNIRDSSIWRLIQQTQQGGASCTHWAVPTIGSHTWREFATAKCWGTCL